MLKNNNNAEQQQHHNSKNDEINLPKKRPTPVVGGGANFAEGANFAVWCNLAGGANFAVCAIMTPGAMLGRMGISKMAVVRWEERR